MKKKAKGTSGKGTKGNKRKKKGGSTALAVILWILAIVAAVGIAIGVSVQFIPLRGADEVGKEIVAPEWIVGGLDEFGRPTEATDTVYTKDAFSCRELVVFLDADAEFTYQVFFYDDKENFVEATEILDMSVFSFEHSAAVSKARVVLYPFEVADALSQEVAIALGAKLTMTAYCN